MWNDFPVEVYNGLVDSLVIFEHAGNFGCARIADAVEGITRPQVNRNTVAIDTDTSNPAQAYQVIVGIGIFDRRQQITHMLFRQFSH